MDLVFIAVGSGVRGLHAGQNGSSIVTSVMLRSWEILYFVFIGE